MIDLSKLPLPPNCPYFYDHVIDGPVFSEHKTSAWPLKRVRAEDTDLPIICSVAAEYWDRERIAAQQEYERCSLADPALGEKHARWLNAEGNVNLWRSAMRSPE